MIKPTLKLPSKHIVIITVIVIAALALVAVSIAGYEKQKQDNDKAARLQASQQAALAAKAAAYQHSLQVQAKTEHDKRVAVCAYVTQVAQAKQTRGLITVPVTSCSN